MNLTIFPPRATSSPHGTEVHFPGRGPEGDFGIRIAHSLTSENAEYGASLGDAALTLFLLPALRLGVPLEIQAPVSAHLLETAPVLQEIYRTWYPDIFPKEIPVSASSALTRESQPPPAASMGCFFSGGVDSFHAALKHRHALGKLIFVHGFDLPLGNAALRSEVSSHIKSAAEGLGIPLVEVETDVRDFSDRYAHWGSHYCGAAMGAVAHLLSPWLGRVVIPATMSYRDLQPFGTHIYTDERWSSERLRLVHDGMEARRIDKMRRIIGEPSVLRHLRVCWRNLDGKYNCGRCEKCLRTMANLRALGVLRECATFPPELDLEQLAKVPVEHPAIIPFLKETLEAAEGANDPMLAGAVRQCLADGLAIMLAREITPVREWLPQADVWRTKTVPRFRDPILEACWTQNSEWTGQELLRHVAHDPEAIMDMLWQRQRGWVLRRWLMDCLSRLNPFRRRSNARNGSQVLADD